ncbi:MAG: hypothetical protein HYR62_09460 [Actinobacteria bacterium]|nr:hypothetical protein [Actinomycetota bacterium]MBI3688019.1 hypothetical protein [Actinomycetota bacterium]
MTREIPSPLRAAAGLAVTAFDEARRLPDRLAALPVLALSSAMQASMKVQQRYAELVGRGDQLLTGLARSEEQSHWARFDEDDHDTDTDTDTDTDDRDDVPPRTGPAAPVANYDQLSLAQLRGHLRALSAADVQALIDYERANADRPPFLTMLHNRLARLGHG